MQQNHNHNINIGGKIGFSPNNAHNEEGERGAIVFIGKEDENGDYTVNESKTTLNPISVPQKNDVLIIKTADNLESFIVDAVNGKNVSATRFDSFTLINAAGDKERSLNMAIGESRIIHGGRVSRFSFNPEQVETYSTPGKYFIVYGDISKRSKIVAECICMNKSPLMQSSKVEKFIKGDNTYNCSVCYNKWITDGNGDKCPKCGTTVPNRKSIASIPGVTTPDSSLGYIYNYAISTDDSCELLGNYNNECFEDCTIILKNWNDVSSVTNTYDFSSIINDDNYVINLYEYKKNDFDLITKHFILSTTTKNLR